jgi:hypothetical protein
MRIFTYYGRLVEEIGRVERERVLFLQPIRESDKKLCPHCGKPVPTEIIVVEDSLDFQHNALPVETLTPPSAGE